MTQNPVEAALEDLATCLCASLIAADLPAVCFCGVVPGEGTALDYAGDCGDGACGMAWVRLSALYPSAILGSPDTNPGNCGTLIGLDAEMGVVRCVPVMDDRGNFPSAEDYLVSTRLQIADSLAMRRAVACCLNSKDWILGGYAPLGPQGGVVGGVWTLSMQVF